MHYVYIIRSTSHPDETYIGYSTDLKQRIIDHNNGLSKHTSKFMPWDLLWAGIFQTKEKAQAFEKYLKTASGRAFRNKRLL